MILSVVAALVASGQVLPEINRSFLDRQARIEARRGPAAQAVDRPREAPAGARLEGAAAPSGSTPPDSPGPQGPRIASHLAIVGM